MKNRLQAFTVLELLIAMILSAIVFITAFTMYIYTFKEIGSIKEINSDMIGKASLYNVFRNDVLNTQLITGSREKLEMVNSENRKISYICTPLYTLRCENELCDTFFVAMKNLEISYLQQESGEHQLVKSISMQIGSGNDILPFYTVKKYSAYDLISKFGPYTEEQ